MKKSFILYLDSLDVLDVLSDKDTADLFRAIKKYANGEDIKLNGIMEAVFIPFKNQLKRDLEKWENFCKLQKEKGQKGGRPKGKKPEKPDGLFQNPKKPEPFLENPKNPINVTVNVTDNVNDNDNKNDNENKEEKRMKKEDIEKYNSDAEEIYCDYVEKIKAGKRDFAISKIRHLLSEGITKEQLLLCISNLREYYLFLKTETKYRMNCEIFFTENWKDYTIAPPRVEVERNRKIPMRIG